MIGGPWYPWALKRLGINNIHETFGERNIIERWFRELKERTGRFYNNINSKVVKSMEDIVAAVALVHNMLLGNKRIRGVIPS
ncbi:MAG: hypothetical protein QW756_04730 [Nitrososphaerota archaeon]